MLPPLQLYVQAVYRIVNVLAEFIYSRERMQVLLVFDFLAVKVYCYQIVFYVISATVDLQHMLRQSHHIFYITALMLDTLLYNNLEPYEQNTQRPVSIIKLRDIGYPRNSDFAAHPVQSYTNTL